MKTLAFEPLKLGQVPNSSTLVALENPLVLDLEEFPELRWLSTYLTYLQSLQSECNRINHTIQSITAAGDVYRKCWIEAYTKTKNRKDYTYYQLRWLTGERKQSGQPKVKTKHLSHRAVAEVQAAITRGEQVEALERERRQVEAEIERAKSLVQGTGRRLQQLISQNSNLWEGNQDDQ